MAATEKVGIMKISQILNIKGWTVTTLPPGSKISDAASILADRNIGIAVIADDDRVVHGVISERDITRGLAHHGVAVIDMATDDLMTSEVITCSPETTVRDVLQLMATYDIRHLPVTQDEKLVGVISIRDVVDTRLGELETENESLRQLLTEAA